MKPEKKSTIKFFNVLKTNQETLFNNRNHQNQLMIVSFILIGALYRVLLSSHFFHSFTHLTPIMALAFCGGLFFNHKTRLFIPTLILLISDGIINLGSGFPFFGTWTLISSTCYIFATFLGNFLSYRKSWANLVGGTLVSSLVFYFISNTYSFFWDPNYAKNWEGWIQALTVGIPGYPPTWMFLRNSLIGDLSFTIVLGLIMKKQFALKSRFTSIAQKSF